jgi:hypothetical protein
MLTILALIFATAFPSSSKVSWMRPESFHLSIGMSRSDALRKLQEGGWKAQKGDDASHMVVDYSSTQSLTLDFQKERLRSIRFELFTILSQIDSAFEEEKAYLRKAFGEPKPVKSKAMLVYDSTLPNIMAVVSNKPKSENGKRGLGVLVVRYYDPLAEK